MQYRSNKILIGTSEIAKYIDLFTNDMEHFKTMELQKLVINEKRYAQQY